MQQATTALARAPEHDIAFLRGEGGLAVVYDAMLQQPMRRLCSGDMEADVVSVGSARAVGIDNGGNSPVFGQCGARRALVSPLCPFKPI